MYRMIAPINEFIDFAQEGGRRNRSQNQQGGKRRKTRKGKKPKKSKKGKIDKRLESLHKIKGLAYELKDLILKIYL